LKLLEEEERLKDQNKIDEDTTAFAAWSANKHRQNQRNQWENSGSSGSGGNGGRNNYTGGRPNLPNVAPTSGRYPHPTGRAGSTYGNSQYSNQTYEQRRERQLYYENLKRNTTCYECGEPGHWGKECAKRYNRLKDENERRQQANHGRGFFATEQTVTEKDSTNTTVDAAFMAKDHALTGVSLGSSLGSS